MNTTDNLTDKLNFSKTLIAAFSLLLLTGMGAADTVTVGDGTADNSTIGAAINYASSGDTIEVEDGTYNEMVLINKSSLTIKPAGDYRPVIHQDSNDWTAVHVNASDVTIEGFSIKNTNNDDSNRVRGIHGDKYSDGLTIRDVVVDGVEGPDQHPERTAYGMTLSADSTTVEDSEVKNVNAAYFAAGIRLGGNSTRKVSNGTIDNVDISNIETTDNQSAGILLSSIASTEETEITDSKIEGLSKNAGTAGVSIGSTNTDATTPDLRIEGNDINATTTTDMGTAIYVENISDSTTLSDLSQIVVSNNDFSGSDAGAANKALSLTLDASENYWGTDNPNFNSVISGDVNYQPWYATSDFSEDVEVVDSSGDTRAYSGTIQEALNVAAEDATIELGPGTYEEKVSIDTSNVTLQGPNAGIDANRDARSDEAVITGQVSIGAQKVTVNGLKVTPTTETFNQKPAAAIIVSESDATVQNNRIADFNVSITDIEPNSIQGIQIYNSGTQISGIEIQGNSVANITYEGSSQAPSGDFGTDYGNLYGIHVQGEIGDTVVEQNTIRDLTSDGYTLATAVSGTDSDQTANPEEIVVKGNIYENLNAKGLPATAFVISSDDVDATNVRVNNNSINAPVGVYNGASEKLDATSNWWAQDSGPTDSQVSGNVDYRPWRMTPIDEDGYDEVITFNDSESWSAFSVVGEVEDAATASGDAEVLGYNAGWTSPDVNDMSSVDAAFVKNTKAVGVNYVEDPGAVSRTLGEGWNFIGAYKNIDSEWSDLIEQEGIAIHSPDTDLSFPLEPNEDSEFSHPQSVRNVFSPVESSIVSFQAPGEHNGDKASLERYFDYGPYSGTILSTSNWDSSEAFNALASIYDGYWVKASETATLSTTPEPVEEG
jgi:hypothetical protein